MTTATGVGDSYAVKQANLDGPRHIHTIEVCTRGEKRCNHFFDKV